MSLPIILGSSSKWRRNELAKMLGLPSPQEIATMSPDIDEKAIRHDDPKEMTLLIARAKATALLPKVTSPSILICSDQVIICDGEIREKPETEDVARRYLKSYRTHPAEAVDAVVVMITATGVSYEGIATAKLHFKHLPDEFIDKLIEQGDLFTCSGGFVVELMTDYMGVLEGEIETIQGMPKTLTLDLIAKAQASNNKN